MLEVTAAPEGRAFVRVAPARRAIVSWSTTAERGAIEIVVHTVDGRSSKVLPYVAFEPDARASLDGFDTIARIATDIVRANGEIAALEITANVALDQVSVSVPLHGPERTHAPFVGELDVPLCSQYLAGNDERGWCAPASLVMLLGAHGAAAALPDVAAAVYDRAYDGTGNWAFVVAHARRYDLFGAVAYLRGLASLDTLLAAGLPAATSIRWTEGTLPGAALPASEGHLVVVRGRDPAGNVIVNDPAQPDVRTVYDADAFERAWLRHSGVALLVAPFARIDDLVACANH